jgi:hypothetical protein
LFSTTFDKLQQQQYTKREEKKGDPGPQRAAKEIDRQQQPTGLSMSAAAAVAVP